MATFLTKKHLSRRALLRGSGVAMALPFLEAMVPAGTALAQVEAMPKKRAGFFYLPHGTIQNNTPFGKEVTDEEVKTTLAEEIAAILAPVALPLVIEPARAPHVVGDRRDAVVAALTAAEDIEVSVIPTKTRPRSVYRRIM